jgi:hypothetical protein
LKRAISGPFWSGESGGILSFTEGDKTVPVNNGPPHTAIEGKIPVVKTKIAPDDLLVAADGSVLQRLDLLHA